MNTLNAQKNKNILLLALVSVFAAVLFSFLSAPFLRALFATVRARVFWMLGFLLITILFVIGLADYKISETAVYVGALWMTLGTYSELEKRGVNWKGAGLASLSAGFIFALAGYFLVLKNLSTENTLAQIVEPLQLAILQAFPGTTREDFQVASVFPGILIASLFGILAMGLALESKVIKTFNLKREKIVSALRWLEFRLPSSIIWIFLSVAFILAQSFVKMPSSVVTVCENLTIVLATGFFFQGMAVVEFMLRFSQAGPLTKTITYVLIILQLAPFIALIGFVDYWVEFRTLIRKKAKLKNN